MEHFKRKKEGKGKISGILFFGEAWTSSPQIEYIFSVFKPKMKANAEIMIGGEVNDFGIRLSFFIFSLYLSLGKVISGKFKSKAYEKNKIKAEKLSLKRNRKIYAHEIDIWDSGRTTGFSLYLGYLFIHLWDSGTGVSNDQLKSMPWNSKGWSFSFNFEEFLMGELNTEWGEELIDDGMIFLEEGAYLLDIRRQLVIQRRTRFPFSKFSKKFYRALRVTNGKVPVGCTKGDQLIFHSEDTLRLYKEYPDLDEVIEDFTQEIVDMRKRKEFETEGLIPPRECQCIAV